MEATQGDRGCWGACVDLNTELTAHSRVCDCKAGRPHRPQEPNRRQSMVLKGQSHRKQSALKSVVDALGGHPEQMTRGDWKFESGVLGRGAGTTGARGVVWCLHSDPRPCHPSPKTGSHRSERLGGRSVIREMKRPQKRGTLHTHKGPASLTWSP